MENEKKYVVMEGKDFRQSLLDVMMESINSTMQMMADNQTKMFPMSSLHISAHKKKYFVGDQVVIENGILIHSPGEVPTHEIIDLQGTLSDNKHSITLKHLFTNQTIKIDL